MYEGMSYLKLYYNKACTRELPKDEEGNYVYNLKNITANAIMPLVINLWCKNEGSHSAYDITFEILSSDVSSSVASHSPSLYSTQIIPFKLNVDIVKGDIANHSIVLRFEYDSI